MERVIKIVVVVILAFLFFVYIHIEIGPPPSKPQEVSKPVVEVFPTETDIGKVVSKIKTLDPGISILKARKVAYYFLLTTKEYGVDPDIFLAIGFQENSFGYSGINKSDVGMWQINYYWQIIKKGRRDLYTIEELDNNWQLNMRLGAEHLKECEQEAPRYKNIAWWTCYNTYKNDRGQRRLYQDYVIRHLNKLREIK